MFSKPLKIILLSDINLFVIIPDLTLSPRVFENILYYLSMLRRFLLF